MYFFPCIEKTTKSLRSTVYKSSSHDHPLRLTNFPTGLPWIEVVAPVSVPLPVQGKCLRCSRSELWSQFQQAHAVKQNLSVQLRPPRPIARPVLVRQRAHAPGQAPKKWYSKDDAVTQLTSSCDSFPLGLAENCGGCILSLESGYYWPSFRVFEDRHPSRDMENFGYLMSHDVSISDISQMSCCLKMSAVACMLEVRLSSDHTSKLLKMRFKPEKQHQPPSATIIGNQAAPVSHKLFGSSFKFSCRGRRLKATAWNAAYWCRSWRLSFLIGGFKPFET